MSTALLMAFIPSEARRCFHLLRSIIDMRIADQGADIAAAVFFIFNMDKVLEDLLSYAS